MGHDQMRLNYEHKGCVIMNTTLNKSTFKSKNKLSELCSIFFLFLLQIHALLTIQTIFYFHSGLKIKN